MCSPSAVLVDILIAQAITDPHQRARKLCEILEERDDDLLPVFCQTLIDTGQRQVARLLGFPGSSVAIVVRHWSITLREFHLNEITILPLPKSETDRMRCSPTTSSI